MRHQGERPSGVHWAHLKGLLQAGQHYPNTASCSAQGWDREGLPNREEKTKAKVKSNAFGKGDARWGRSSWPLVIMTGLFCSAVTCSMSTPFHSDSNRGDGCRSLLAEFLHLPNQYRIWYINPRFELEPARKFKKKKKKRHFTWLIYNYTSSRSDCCMSISLPQALPLHPQSPPKAGNLEKRERGNTRYVEG